MSFTHLHLHTQYSLLDGAIIIPDLVSHLGNSGMEACAITDHGWMAGIIEFYKACKKSHIKPLIGIEAYITNDLDNQPNELKSRDNLHMVLIAKDNEGLRRLLRVSSHAALNNFYYKPRINITHLEEFSGHVVATSACLGGIIAQRLTFHLDSYGKAIVCTDDQKRVDTELVFYQKVFGEDFFLEVQVVNDPTNYQQVYNKYLLEKAKEHGIPLVITSDCHYLHKDDFELHELLMAMQFKSTLDEYREKPETAYGPDFYVATPEEMKKRAASIGADEAIDNVQDITEKCNVEIELGKYQVPTFQVQLTEDYQDFLEWKQNVIA